MAVVVGQWRWQREAINFDFETLDVAAVALVYLVRGSVNPIDVACCLACGWHCVGAWQMNQPQPIYHIGIDPGLSGACVIVSQYGEVYHDCPRRNGAEKLSINQHDSKAMLSYLLPYVGKSRAILELVRFDARDERHKVSAEILVRSHEAWATVLDCLDIPTQHLYPVQWRKPLGLSGDVGEVYVNEALRLYPQCREWLYYKARNGKWCQNHNRAESLLMGHLSKMQTMDSVAAVYREIAS